MGRYVGFCGLIAILFLFSCSSSKKDKVTVKAEEAEMTCMQELTYALYDSLTYQGDVIVCVNSTTEFRGVQISFPDETFELRFMDEKRGVFKKTEGGLTKLGDLDYSDESLIFTTFENEYQFHPLTKVYNLNNKSYEITSYVENYRGTSTDENRGYYLKDFGLILLSVSDTDKYLKLVNPPINSNLSKEELSLLLDSLMTDTKFCDPMRANRLTKPPEE